MVEKECKSVVEEQTDLENEIRFLAHLGYIWVEWLWIYSETHLLFWNSLAML